MKRFIVLIFIEGASVMAAELCSAKLMAPYFGSSLYVWAAVLAITLMGLAAGYFYGGFLSSKNAPEKSLYIILLIAAFCLAAMVFVSNYLVPFLSDFPFKPAVVLSVFLLIFFPVFFLGASSPLFIRLLAQTVEQSGLISGKIYALSTLGGIVSTFLCGFYLIPEWGLYTTVLVFSVLLLVATVISFGMRNPIIPIFLLLLCLIAAKVTSANHSVLWFQHGVLGELKVQDVETEEGIIRQLSINKIIQTEVNLTTNKSSLKYLHTLDSLIKPASNTNQKAIVLGLGGGVLAGILTKKGYQVTGVEFDERIIEAASKFFKLDSSVHVVCDDARRFLNNCNQKFDIVVFDLFRAEEQPAHIITMESLNLLKEMINGNGQAFINWHGYLDPPLGHGTQVLLNTLQASGFAYSITPTGENPNYRNLVVEFKASEKLLYKGILVNTDTRPLLEKANASANLEWRKNYLKYYRAIRQ